MSGKPTDPVARFWRNVNQTGPVANPTLGRCWQWLGKPHKSGYGRHGVGGAVVYAHRFAYETLVGPIPDGLQLDHLCRNTMCVRPSHLEAVTQQANMLRGTGPQAANARKTHCPQGHPLAGDNVYVSNHGRRCRRCNTESARAYRRRKAVAA